MCSSSLPMRRRAPRLTTPCHVPFHLSQGFETVAALRSSGLAASALEQLGFKRGHALLVARALPPNSGQPLSKTTHEAATVVAAPAAKPSLAAAAAAPAPAPAEPGADLAVPSFDFGVKRRPLAKLEACIPNMARGLRHTFLIWREAGGRHSLYGAEPETHLPTRAQGWRHTFLIWREAGAARPPS